MLDGEIVAFDGPQTSFARLQGRIGLHDPDAARATGIAVFLYLFDVLVLDGRDVTALPLRDRKRLLRDAVDFGGALRMSTHRNTEGEAYLREACRRGWEGLVAKRADAPYRPGRRSPDWLKLKCVHEQELVVGGWTDPQRSRTGFGALLVGYYARRRPAYAGKVGTGFDHRMLADLSADSAISPPTARRSRSRCARRARTGCARSWSRRSGSANGPATASCAIPATSGFATTSRRGTWCARSEPARLRVAPCMTTATSPEQASAIVDKAALIAYKPIGLAFSIWAACWPTSPSGRCGSGSRTPRPRRTPPTRTTRRARCCSPPCCRERCSG